MIYIIAAILIFGVLIAVHELGHFLAVSYTHLTLPTIA